ncbi:MAG TPA: AI-2E family transporter [Polyangia bacterium]|nr:AI-2E family transporter [Polyangia bacterium]
MDARPDDRWTSARVVKFTALVILVGAVARAIVAARVPLLMSFLAVVLSVVLCFPIDWFSRRMPRWLALLLTIVLFAAIVVGLGWWVFPIVRGQLSQLPQALTSARKRLAPFLATVGMGGAQSSAAAAQDPAKTVERALPIAYSTFEVATAVVFVVVLAFFLASGRDGLHRGIRRMVPREHQPFFDEWWDRLRTTLRHWTGGIVVAMTIMGTVTGISLWIAGISSPLLLGVITFFGTFVPYVGAVASAIPGLAVGLSQSPRHFWYAIAIYVIVHHVEGYLVQPFIMRRAVDLKPALLLCWEAVAAAVFGIPGIIVATPLLACIQVTVEDLWIDRTLRRHARC